MNQNQIKEAKEAIENAGALLITAGAGMGVDSGLPDFRGKEGFWKAYPHAAQRGLSFSDLANPHWFTRDPKLAWAFYGHRLNLYRKTEPHEGFRDLLKLGESMPGGCFVYTSNVDGQFQKAGFSEERIEECHGSIHHFQCSHPCSPDIFRAEEGEILIDMETFQAVPPLPGCKKCGSVARPNILMFGDIGWISHRTEEQSERFTAFIDTVLREKTPLVIIEVGAGESVPTVRMTSEQTASRTKGRLIRINPRDFHVPSGHISIPMNGLEGIRALLE